MKETQRFEKVTTKVVEDITSVTVNSWSETPSTYDSTRTIEYKSEDWHYADTYGERGAKVEDRQLVGVLNEVEYFHRNATRQTENLKRVLNEAEAKAASDALEDARGEIGALSRRVSELENFILANNLPLPGALVTEPPADQDALLPSS
jgi:hypothetical protein